MKKKIFTTMLIILLAIGVTGCSNKEKAIKDDNLVNVAIDDDYRTYYEIFVGSFSDSNKDGIGDINGIINRLDYLNDGNPDSGLSLGVDGIWLSPFNPSKSYHKYDVMDYYAIDKSLGKMEDFERLMAECKKRDINVIMDLVLNHTSSAHPWFLEAKKALQAGDLGNKYIDYYSIVKSADKESGKAYYKITGDYHYEGNFSPEMPELNMDNQAVKDEIAKIVKFWTEKGIGGFRLDAAKYVYLNDTTKNVEFWNWFMKEVKKANPKAYVVGEVWSGDAILTPYYEAINCFDFGMASSTGAITLAAKGQDDVNAFVRYISRYQQTVLNTNSQAILNPFISNHDMNRAAGALSVKDKQMQVAANLYLLSAGNPFIYYGEEIGMKGVRGTESTDANRRLAMLWGDKDTIEDPKGATYDKKMQSNGTVKSQVGDKNSLFNHYKKLIMIRNANPEIARGIYEPIDFKGYQTFGGYLTTYNNSSVGIFHNTSDSEIMIDLSSFTNHKFTTLRGICGSNASLSGQTLTISAMSSAVLK